MRDPAGDSPALATSEPDGAAVGGLPRSVGIFGIGNLLRADDGIGPLVAQRLDAEYEFAPGVYVGDLGTPGLDLASHIAGFETLILIDAIVDGSAPGSLRRLADAELLCARQPGSEASNQEAAPRGGIRMTQHEADLREAMWLADAAGRPVGEIILIGVTPASLDQGYGLTPSVAGAVERAVDMVIAELRRLGVRARRRTQPGRTL